MFGSVMRSWFLSLRYHPIVIVEDNTSSTVLGTTPNSWISFCIHTASFAASKAAVYLASVLESVVVYCLEWFQATTPTLNLNRNLDCDLASSSS
ncbi:UNVERIFIED_CONTAM: hypothetical protein Sangu_2885400 [Sesamum angustifolium]|uniref:Uncharacterized protein n=1 Tax=Sesamum angustifolium TaxID=2727405 RepID=A0AAW2INH8_9LAMI